MANQHKNQHYLFLMLGFPGSGKSFISQWLSPLFQAVQLRSDDLRLAMFGEDRKELHDAAHKKQVNNAMRYAAQQILAAQQSVIYDVNNNFYKTRKAMSALAKNFGAPTIIVWTKVPLELAKERTVTREAAGGHKVFDAGFVEKMASRLEPPSSHEKVIILDGTQTVAEQQTDFQNQFTRLIV